MISSSCAMRVVPFRKVLVAPVSAGVWGTGWGGGVNPEEPGGGCRRRIFGPGEPGAQRRRASCR